MKKGKINSTILKRSVFKCIGCRSLYKKHKLSAGGGATVLKADTFGQSAQVIMDIKSGFAPVIAAINGIVAKGGEPKAIQASILLSEEDREIRLKEIVRDISAKCSAYGIDYAGGTTMVSNRVNKPVVTISCVGELTGEQDMHGKNIQPGEDIILTKWIGIGGIRQIIDARKAEILEKYMEDVVATAYGKEEYLSICEEARLLRDKVTYMMPLGEGGIYGGLWNLAEAAGKGVEADSRRIPVCQEIIEICEIYDINPYELDSTGCLLMTSSQGCDIIDILETNGIPASIIGKIREDNDKIVVNLDEVRYIDLPGQDKVYGLI